MIDWLKLIRWKNLALIFISQSLIFHYLYPNNELPLDIILYFFYTFFITAGGNIINDYFDIIPDKKNKPHKLIVGHHINLQQTLIGYYVFNIIGFSLNLIALYLSANILVFNMVNIIMILLYYYSKTLKGKPFIGNILVAALTGISILLISFIIESNASQKRIIYTLSFFAFMLNLIREIVKDIEDIKGDSIAKLKTLPIIIGVKRTVVILKVLMIITSVLLITLSYFTNTIILKTYLIIPITIPLLYCYYMLKQPFKKNLLSKISSILKLIIAFGIFTVIFT